MTKFELQHIPHPTDQLIQCRECEESNATFTTFAEAADWIRNHAQTKHGAKL